MWWAPENVKKEGTGKPQNPDITFGANVRARELYFEEVPDPEVRFRGNTRRNSVWESGRENLPDEVREGVVYSNPGIRVWIASEIADGEPGLMDSSSKERENTNTEPPSQKTRKKKTDVTEEKK